MLITAPQSSSFGHQQGVARRPGVVDQDVQPAQVGLHLLDEPGSLLRIAHIRLVDGTGATRRRDLLHDGIGAIGVAAVVHGDFGAACGEVPAQSLRRSCYCCLLPALPDRKPMLTILIPCDGRTSGTPSHLFFAGALYPASAKFETNRPAPRVRTM